MIFLKVIDSHCPGCSILCGIQIIEDEGQIDIDFQKYCPINAGKLCKFGIDLPWYYSGALDTSTVFGELVDYDTAIAKAAKRLSKWYRSSGGKEGIVLCCGDATNEEQLAMKYFALSLGMKCASGLGHVLKTIGKSPFIHDIMNFDILEGVEKIVLVNIDPYYQYPLLARKLQLAKEKGIPIVAIGPEGSHIAGMASDIVLCNPADTIDSFREYCKGQGEKYTLYITSLGVYSDPSLIAEINNVCSISNSRVFFLKDFANSEASIILDFNKYNEGLEGIIEQIEHGRINSLVLIESPLYDTYLDDERFFKACEVLDVLIVVQSTRPKKLPNNAILLPMPPFYKRKGALVNTCGRFLGLGGEEEGVINVLRDVASLLNIKNIPKFDELADESRKIYQKWTMDFKSYEAVDVPDVPKPEYGMTHYYVVNPQLLRGMRHQLVKRCGKDSYKALSKKERYLIRQDMAEGVIVSYQKDERFKKMIESYD